MGLLHLLANNYGHVSKQQDKTISYNSVIRF